MGVGERRGGRRAGGRRRAHHRHNHHHHRNRNRGRRNRHHHHHGGRALFTFRMGNRAGGSGPGGGMAVTPGYYALLVIFTMFGMFGFAVGMTLANIGGWTSTSLGIVGMVFLLTSFTFVVIVVVIRCNMKKISTNPQQGGVEAGTMNPNMTVSTVTLGGSTTASQVSETTSYIIQTGAVQPGGVAMGTQPGYPGGPAQPYPQPPPQNYPGAPYPPHPNGATQYPPPTNPAAAAPMPYPQPEAPPINYTTLYPAQPPPTHSHGGVVDPASDLNGLAPPPTYDDVMTGNVKYDEGSGAGSGPT